MPSSTANQPAWNRSKSPSRSMAAVRNPNVPSLASSHCCSATASPRTASGTCGTTTPTRLTPQSRASRRIAKRTLVNSHQTARKGFSRANERDQPAATGRRPAAGSRRALPVATLGSLRGGRQDSADALLELALLDGAAYVRSPIRLKERPGEHAPDHSFSIDEERRRQAEQAVGVAHLAVDVDADGKVHPEVLRERTRGVLSFLEVHTDDHQPLVLIPVVGAHQLRHLFAAGNAPGRPEVDHDRLAAQVAQAQLAAVQPVQQENGGQIPFLHAHV